MVEYEVFGDSNISRSWRAVATDLHHLKRCVVRPLTTLALLKETLRTVDEGFMLLSALSSTACTGRGGGGNKNLNIKY
jgi:hypothetical protein